MLSQIFSNNIDLNAPVRAE